MFRKAQRRKAKLRLAILGPSGSGKTYSSLLIAQGLGGKIAMIDTERGSGELYSDMAAYDVLQLDPPFSPQRYIEAIREAENQGYDVLIIDSISHAWVGQGGVLDMHDEVSRRSKNSFMAWREVTPHQNKLLDAILNSNLHVIVTMRTKTAYEVTKDEKTGKSKPVKIGLAPQQRDGIEYEFTLVLELSQERHTALASKDRTGLFDGTFFVPDLSTGKRLLEWLESGVEEPALPETDSFLLVQLFKILHDPALAIPVDLYESYARSKYAVASIEGLTPGQISEQLGMLSGMRSDRDRRGKFLEYLGTFRVAA